MEHVLQTLMIVDLYGTAPRLGNVMNVNVSDEEEKGGVEEKEKEKKKILG